MCDRVIITGGNGFIGRSMVEYFLSQNVKIVYGKGESDQGAGGHAMCQLPCSLMF